MDIDADKIVEKIKRDREKESRKQIYFRIKASIAEEFKQACNERHVNYNEVLENLLAIFNSSAEKSSE